MTRDGLVLVTDQYNTRAFDALSGHEIWKNEASNSRAYLTCCSLDSAGTGWVISQKRGFGVCAFDSRSGNIKWQVPVPANLGPAHDGFGRLFVASLHREDSGTAELYALDSGSGQTLWHVALDKSLSTPDGSYAFSPNDIRVDQPTIPSWPAIGANGTVYVSASNDHGPGDSVFYSRLFAFSAVSGRLLFEFKPDSPTAAPAVGSDGTVYVQSARFLYAIDGRTGARRWAVPTGGSASPEATVSPAIGKDGTVYVTTNEGHVLAVGSRTVPLTTRPNGRRRP